MRLPVSLKPSPVGKVAQQGRMKGRFATAIRLRATEARFPLISQRAGPLTASPKGEAIHRAKPRVSSSPSIRFMHCTAAPELPLPRLSNRLISCIWVPSGLARQ